jgi:hypothetical protein
MAEQRRQTRDAWLADLNKLRDEWGVPTFTRKAQLAHRLLTDAKRGNPEVLQLLDSTGFGDYPPLFQWIAGLAEDYAEDGLIDGKVEGALDATGLAQKIEEVRTKLTQLERGSPAYKTTLDQYEELIKTQAHQMARAGAA